MTMIANEHARKLLLMGSDPGQSNDLSHYLSRQGFRVTAARSRRHLMDLAGRREFGLALLDTPPHAPDLEPDSDWARVMYERKDLGVIVLAANSDSRDRVRALELGADDYLSRPIHQTELVARIRAVMRRYPEPQDKPAQVWRLHGVGRCLISPDRTRIGLTPRELELMDLLTEHQGKAVSRDTVAQSLMGREWLPGDRSVDVLVRRLRTKLKPVGGANLIDTVRYVGYRIAAGRVSR
jgi:DNA-binding response OmpR family regulator